MLYILGYKSDPLARGVCSAVSLNAYVLKKSMMSSVDASETFFMIASSDVNAKLVAIMV